MKHTNLKTLLGGAALTLLFALPAQAAAENFDDAFAQSIAKKAASKSAAAKLATRIQPGQQRYGGEESRGIRGEVPVQEYGQAAANPFEEEHKSEQQPSAAAAAVDFDSAFAQSIAAKKVAKTTAAKLAARIQPGQQKYGGASESASAATALEDFAPSSADEPQASAAASAAEEAVPDFDTAFTKALANRDTAKQKMTERFS